MKIGNGSGIGIDLTDRSNSSGGTNRTSNTENSSTENASDSVKLSGLSARLQDLEKSLSASPAFDSQKVQDITQAIRDGRFTVNSEVVADKLIASVRELVG